MRRVQKSVLVPYSAQQMFDLIDRIEDYPTFLPWCGGTQVSRGASRVQAAITIDFAGLKQAFTTVNHNTPHERIAMQLQDGPFSQLEGEWNFSALKADACKVALDLRYDFRSALLAAAVGPVFDMIADSMIDAFTDRAEVLYG